MDYVCLAVCVFYFAFRAISAHSLEVHVHIRCLSWRNWLGKMVPFCSPTGAPTHVYTHCHRSVILPVGFFFLSIAVGKKPYRNW